VALRGLWDRKGRHRCGLRHQREKKLFRKVKVPTSSWLGAGLLWALPSLSWMEFAPWQWPHLGELPQSFQDLQRRYCLAECDGPASLYKTSKIIGHLPRLPPCLPGSGPTLKNSLRAFRICKADLAWLHVMALLAHTKHRKSSAIFPGFLPAYQAGFSTSRASLLALPSSVTSNHNMAKQGTV
jgi:hypothetical protein